VSIVARLAALPTLHNPRSWPILAAALACFHGTEKVMQVDFVLMNSAEW
jgi:hypothetical protein